MASPLPGREARAQQLLWGRGDERRGGRKFPDPLMPPSSARFLKNLGSRKESFLGPSSGGFPEAVGYLPQQPPRAKKKMRTAAIIRRTDQLIAVTLFLVKSFPCNCKSFPLECKLPGYPDLYEVEPQSPAMTCPQVTLRKEKEALMADTAGSSRWGGGVHQLPLPPPGKS